ncbi:hypothetical protein ACN47E_009728 [Coniothyrium glycines]
MAVRKKPLSIATSTKVANARSSKSSIIASETPTTNLLLAVPPIRAHETSYHYPLLLSSRSDCDALLAWFTSVEETRNMPWRQTWIDPNEHKGKDEDLERVLAKRAYEVWVSEVMLQQTRVSTVIPYFTNWISIWPTAEALAEAKHDDVLAAWKGLGYYSRATRLHEGAKAMIAKSNGIGRYTAGAISSIVFGEPEPVLDGNVIRVLSRQLGLYMNTKDKKATDILWEQADRLIKHVSLDLGSSRTSIPGQWNQALMELGSTICTPKPLCEMCPIQKTCRVYSEGQALYGEHQLTAVLDDIENKCTLCEPVDIEDLAPVLEEVTTDVVHQTSKKKKVTARQSNTLPKYFAIGTSATIIAPEREASPSAVNHRKRKTSDQRDFSKVVSYCTLFPKKIVKKKAAEVQCVVCMIELCLSNGSTKWLIEQRPAKGLLASLWQFPQELLEDANATPSQRKISAEERIKRLGIGGTNLRRPHHVAAFPPLTHVFTHLRMTMYAYHYRITTDKAEDAVVEHVDAPIHKWVEAGTMDSETLSTGMRKCWNLVSPTL